MEKAPAISHTSEQTEKRRSEWRHYLKTALASAMVLFQQSSLEPEAPVTRFAERHVAATELEMFGTTSERAEARTILSEHLEKGLSPFGYSAEDGATTAEIFFADSKRFIEALVDGFIDTNEKNKAETIAIAMEKFSLSEPVAEAFFEARMDAFRFYLGLPQEHDTFSISEFQPTASTDDKFYYSINDFSERYAAANGQRIIDSETNTMTQVPLGERETLRHMYFSATEVRQFDPEWAPTDLTGIMGRYTLTRGEDEKGIFVSYYDKWDLGGSVEGTKGGLGSPYEIYDRVYISDPSILDDPKLIVHLREDVEE